MVEERVMLRREIKMRFDFYVFFPAFMIACSVVLGLSYKYGGSASFFLSTAQNAAISFLILIVSLLVAYLLVMLLFWLLDKGKASFRGASFADLAKRRLIPYFVFIVACWSPWVFTNYPGMMRDDSVRQLFQTYSVEPYSDGNPLFDTWCFGLFWHLGDFLGDRSLGLFIYCIFQAVVSAACFAFALCYMHKNGVPDFVVYFFLVLVSVVVIFPLSATSMSKDGLNGWIYLLLVVLFIEVFRTQGEVLKDRKFVLAFILIALICSISKKTMLYVLLFSFVVGVVYLGRNRRRVALVFATALVLSYCVGSIFLPSTMKNDAPETSPSAGSAGGVFVILPLQQTARVLHGGLFVDQQTYDRLSRYIYCDGTARLYNPSRADEAASQTVTGTNYSDLIEYLEAWFSLGIQYPLVYAGALSDQLGGWFDPCRQIAFGYDLENDVFSSDHMKIWANYFDGSIDEAASFLSFLNVEKDPLAVQIRSYAVDWASLQLDLCLPVSYGLWCFWLPLIGFCYTLRRRNTPVAFSFILPAMVFVSCLVGPMVLYWYSIPLFYSAPILLSAGSLDRVEKA